MKKEKENEVIALSCDNCNEDLTMRVLSGTQLADPIFVVFGPKFEEKETKIIEFHFCYKDCLVEYFKDKFSEE